MDILMISLARAGGIEVLPEDVLRHRRAQQRVLPAPKSQPQPAGESIFEQLSKLIAAGFFRRAGLKNDTALKTPHLKAQEV